MHFYFFLYLQTGAILTTIGYVHCNHGITPEDDFKSLRLHPEGDLFVDKSLLIEEIVSEWEQNKHILITRPLKFGKTTNMKMLQRFFQIPRTNEEATINRKLFFGGDIEVDGTARTLSKLKIAENTKIVHQHFGKHTVIYLSFKRCALHDHIDIRDSVQEMMKECKDGKHYNSTKMTGNTSLKEITNFMYTCKGKKKSIVLLDDYDSAILSAYSSHAPDTSELSTLYRTFLDVNILKNPYIKPAIIMGVMPEFTPLPMDMVYSVLMEKYSTFFGFLDEEVDRLLHVFSLTSVANDIKTYYRGYKVGSRMLYNPMSIMKCLSNNGTLDAYWENKDYLKIFDYIPASDNIIPNSDYFVIHRGNKSIPLTYTFPYDSREESTFLLCYLINIGYLNVHSQNKIVRPYTDTCTISPVNSPTTTALRAKTFEWLNKALKLKQNHQQNELLEYLSQLKIHEFKLRVRDILQKAFNEKLKGGQEHHYDTMLETLITFPVDYHSFKLNDPPRRDIIFVQTCGKGSQVGIMIAIQKALKKDEHTISKAALKALHGISGMGYEKKLKQDSPTIEYIIIIGIAFCDGLGDTKSEIVKADEIHLIQPTSCITHNITSVTKSSIKNRKYRIDPNITDSSEESDAFKIFLRNSLPATTDLVLQQLEKQLQASKKNRIIFKRFLKCNGIMKNFKQTIYSMWAAIIHPDIHVVTRSPNVTAVYNFPHNYTHIIEAVVAVVHQLHNDTGILTLLNVVQEILQHTNVIPVTKIPINYNNTSVKPRVEIKLVSEKPSPAKKRVVGKIRSWISKIKTAFNNKTKHFHRKLKSLLRGPEVTTSKNAEMFESTRSSSESDSEYE